MKALILRADAKASVETARALIDKGFQILSVDTQAVAHALIRLDTVDLLVMDERIEGQLTHAIALSGERRNPYLSAILVTDRGAEETDDLYDLIPSLYGLAGSGTAPALLAKLALSAVSNIETALARVVRNADAEAAEMADRSEIAPHGLAQAELISPQEEDESGRRCYADVAIAGPAMAEIALAENQFTLRADMGVGVYAAEQVEQGAMLENVEDSLNAEVAALFRKHPLLHHVQPPQSFAAEVVGC